MCSRPAKIPPALAEIIADYRAHRFDAGALSEALRAYLAASAAALPMEVSAEQVAQIEALAERVDMMHFSLCRAERRGAVLGLLAEFCAAWRCAE